MVIKSVETAYRVPYFLVETIHLSVQVPLGYGTYRYLYTVDRYWGPGHTIFDNIGYVLYLQSFLQFVMCWYGSCFVHFYFTPYGYLAFIRLNVIVHFIITKPIISKTRMYPRLFSSRCGSVTFWYGSGCRSGSSDPYGTSK